MTETLITTTLVGVLAFAFGVLAGGVWTLHKLREAAREIIESRRESLALLQVLQATVRWTQMPSERCN